MGHDRNPKQSSLFFFFLQMVSQVEEKLLSSVLCIHSIKTNFSTLENIKQ